MPLNLDSPQTVSATITSVEITSFAVDLEGNTMHVAYDLKDSNGAIVREGILTIPPSEFAAAVGEAEAEYANMNSVYGSIKVSLYKRIMAAEGLTGTIA